MTWLEYLDAAIAVIEQTPAAEIGRTELFRGGNPDDPCCAYGHIQYALGDPPAHMGDRFLLLMDVNDSAENGERRKADVLQWMWGEHARLRALRPRYA